MIVQVLIHGVAAVLLYRTSWYLSKSRGATLATALFFLAWVEIPTWNYYLLAESWYVSLVCLVLYCLVSLNGSPKQWLVTTLVVLLTFFSKPTGIAVLVAYGVFLISYQWVTIRRHAFLAPTVVLVVLGAIYFLVNDMLSTFVLAENYTTGEIVYRASTLENYPNQGWLTIATSDLYLPPTNIEPIPRLLQFIIYNPIYFTKLFLVKLTYFVAHVKPYFSWLHNLAIAVVLFPAYVLLVRCIMHSAMSVHIKRFCVTFLAITTLSVSLTTLDWDARFFVPLLPVIFLLAGQGILTLKSIHG